MGVFTVLVILVQTKWDTYPNNNFAALLDALHKKALKSCSLPSPDAGTSDKLRITANGILKRLQTTAMEKASISTHTTLLLKRL